MSVVGSRRTTSRASLQDLEKQRREPVRMLMARDIYVRQTEIDTYRFRILGETSARSRTSEA